MGWIRAILLLVLITGCGRPSRDAEIAKEYPRLGVTIVVDPGHGGKDPGTRTQCKPVLLEKDLALQTATLLKRHLTRLGFNVIMTRSDDTFIPLQDRAAWPAKERAKLFVSVHYNSAQNRSASGVEVYYYKSKEPNSRRDSSRIMAEHVLKHCVASTGAASRGVQHGDFCVVRENSVPSILVEGAFLSNPDDANIIRDGKYTNRLAMGIAQGIYEHVTSSRRI